MNNGNNGRHNRSLLWLAVSFAATLALSGCFGHKKAAAPATGASAEPDKVLFDNAMNDIKHDRYDEGRLAMQTLINTYPDSEYLAKAKLAVADAYYKEGGTSALTQAVAEYQDFITFFPFLDEAAYAQVQIGMAHYKRMEKPDRDRDEALEAEGAFQTFLQKYPSSPLYKDAQQRLRDVQEVLADGEFRIASFYYLRKANRASAARLAELVERYPLYSEADHANFMLATIYERTEHSDIAAQYYARIVKNYPLSPLVADSKAKLVKFGTPVPQPDPTAMARMQAEQQAPRPSNRLVMRPLGALKSGPDVRMAARTGEPTLTPENSGNTETLVPGASGSTIVGVATAGGSGGSGSATVSADTVPATSSAGSASTSGTTAPVDSTAGSAAPAGSETVGASIVQPVAGSEGTQAVSTTGTATAAAAGTAPGDATQAGSGSGDTATAAAPPSSSTGESTSKKKKGLKKLIP